MPGEAEFFLGPMFSGKTSSLIRQIGVGRKAGLNCVLVKYAGDDRYVSGPAVKTHDGLVAETSPAGEGVGRLRVAVARNLCDVVLDSSEQVVALDEGQFYPDLRMALDGWMREGRQVYIAALDGDYRRLPFPPIAEALPLATGVVKLTATCTTCAAKAAYTIRTARADQMVLIGGSEEYMAACLECYHAYQYTGETFGNK